MVRRSFVAVLAASTLLVSAGCGSGTSPADDVPALATALDRVDEAIATEDYDDARDAVAELTDVATEAEESGDLDAEQADRIVAAAESLVAALPGAESPPDEPDPATPTSSATAEGEDEDEDEEDDEESEPAPPEHAEKPDKHEDDDKKSKGKKKD